MLPVAATERCGCAVLCCVVLQVKLQPSLVEAWLCLGAMHSQAGQLVSSSAMHGCRYPGAALPPLFAAVVCQTQLEVTCVLLCWRA
jgi:hypothetical protein